MSHHPMPAPSKVLGEIQMHLVQRLIETPAAEPVRIDRRHVAILQAAIGELIGQIEVLEEGAAAADRLTKELAIVVADRERWRTAAATYHDAGGREVDRSARRLHLVLAGEVVDLSEEFRRERRDVGRSVGPEGGAA